MTRETFTSRFGLIMTMVGVAVGLGNVWRFPYLVGKYGGSAFVAFYILIVFVIGVPGLMAEWALGRASRRGTVGAFAASGLPGGRWLGWLLFAVVVCATAYYTNVVGWVLFFGLAQLGALFGSGADASGILPPAAGLSGRSLALQVVCSGAVLATCAAVLDRGLRRGIERVSAWIMPTLFVILLLLIARSLTLPGAGEGMRWYLGRFAIADLTPAVMAAALGQVVFSLALGGTFMVTYGSYLADDTDLAPGALWTVTGDTLAGLLAGVAIFPAVFALSLEPTSGPALIFDTLPRVFAAMPLGALFGLSFFAGLFGAAYLSDVAALEVLVVGLTDNTSWPRRRAVWTLALVVWLVALVPMLNMRVFVPWDLTFGSGMQTFGALCAVLTAGWAMHRGTLLRQLARADGHERRFLVFWIRYVVPLGILAVGIWWLLTELLGVYRAA
jgi:NSS family neurotransmitter:Na+ symporter